MTGRDLLKRGFEYNLWANRQWLAYLESKGFPEPDRAIFQHILGSTLAWAMRCEGNPPHEMPRPELSDAMMVDLTDRWLHILDRIDLDTWIDYERFNGEKYRMTLSFMANHVMNHGTYHRGELRGLCRARGDEDFPDTDIAGYAMEAGGGSAR